MLACESIRFFGFSFTRREKPSLFFGGREATTGNTSVVRRLDLCVLQKNLRLVFVLTKSAKVVVEFSTTFLTNQQAIEERLKLALIMKHIAVFTWARDTATLSHSTFKRVRTLPSGAGGTPTIRPSILKKGEKLFNTFLKTTCVAQY